MSWDEDYLSPKVLICIRGAFFLYHGPSRELNIIAEELDTTSSSSD
jgi:hypothetical protein